MSELFVSRPRATEKLGVVAAPAVSAAMTAASVIRVISNRHIHVAITDAAATADVDDMLVYAYHPVFLSLVVGERVTFVRAAGEIDGDVWVTTLDKAS